MIRRSTIIIIRAIAGILLLLLVMLIYRSSPSYRSFMNRSPDYYTRVAEACDQLLAKAPIVSTNQVNTWPGFYTLRGDDSSLPAVLRELHANKVVVGTNRVAMVIGSPRTGYGVVWEPNGVNLGVWELTTAAEGLSRVVYSKNKS